MTDGKSMAADGRMCTGDMIVNDAASKLWYAKDGSICGGAGDAAILELVRCWFQAGEQMDQTPKVDPPHDDVSPISVLVLRPNGRVFYMDHRFAFVRMATPVAIGSGSEVATGLMLAGRSPTEAVKDVARVVTSVGGKVVSRKPRQAR